jgi:methionine-gamma-lyase
MSVKFQRIRDLQHFGEEGGVVPVIDVATSSTFLNPEDMTKVFRGELAGCYLYSRHSNPTVQMFGKKMAALEGTEAALGVSSGMAAISCALDQILSNGDHMVSHGVIYGGTYALFRNYFPKRGIDVTLQTFDSLTELEALIKPNTKAVYIESISNPMLNIANFEMLKEFKAKHPKIKIVVDNTFAPMMFNPVEWGADVILHSCTKFISGASDMVAGCIAGTQEFINSLIDVNHGAVMLTGPVMDPRIAHELYLRLDHLHVRMRAHSERALYLAERLEEAGIQVTYPGLKSHLHHERMKKFTDPEIGFGGMMTLNLKTPEMALKLASKLQENKFGLFAVSLGFSRTLISCPALSTSSEMPEEEQRKINLNPGLLRLSIGITGDMKVMADRMLEAIKTL